MNLPTDILHLILSYLSHNDYAGILKFRTICKEWKEVGDFSPLWLSCELYITAPRAYCLRIHTKPFATPPTSVIIKLDDVIIGLPKMINKYIINIDIEKSKQLRADEISSNFLIKYRLCHRAWDRFLSYHSFLQFFHRWEKEYSQMAKKYNLTYILIALLILSTWLISTLPNYPTSLKWNEILAFAIILLELTMHFFHQVLHFFVFLYDCASYLNMNILHIYQLFPSSHNLIIPLLFTTSVISSVVLLICKFSSDNPSFKYSYIVILPLTLIILGIIAGVTQGWIEYLQEILIMSAMFCICFTCLLVAVYYDEPNHAGISSLGYTLLPLLPIDFMTFAVSVAFLVDAFRLCRDYFQGKITKRILRLQREPLYYCGIEVPRIIIRFYYNVMKTTSVISFLGILIYLHYSSFEGSLDLATSIIIVIVLIILLSISVTSIKGDNSHLS